MKDIGAHTGRAMGLFMLLMVLAGCNNQAGVPSAAGGETPEQIRQYANALKEKELYPQAIEEYERYLGAAGGEAEARANILFVIGNLYMENLSNYEEALAAYVKIATLYPNAAVAEDAKRASVTCLEKLNRSLDAQRQLNRITALDPDQAVPDGSEVVAKIGDKTITMAQVDARIQQLPEYYQNSFTDPAQKLEFLRNMIGTELLYTTAQRKGLNQSPEMRKQIEEAEKQILAQAVLKQEVEGKVTVADSDAKLYYDAHADEFTQPARAKAAHILKETEKEAEAVLLNLEKDGDFAAAARKESTDDATRDKGGEIGYVTEGQPIPGIGQAPELSKAILAANAGDVTGPVQTSRGWHIVKILEKQDAVRRSFEESKQQAAAMLRRQREEEKRQELIQSMMAAEKVVIYDDKFIPAQEAQPTP